jgi:hypothetical protein
MSRAADRHRQQLASSRPVYDRPNEAPEDRNKIPPADRCTASTKTGRHDFSSFSNDDPPGSGLRSARCWYCRALSPRSQARIDAWRLAQERGPMPSEPTLLQRPEPPENGE